MATFDYSRFADLADRMTTKFGTVSIAYTHISAGTYDPSTRSPAAVETAVTIKAIVIETKTHTDRKTQDQMFSAGGGEYAVQSKDAVLFDMAFLMVPSGEFSQNPVVGDRVTFWGKNWLVDGVTEINPGGTSIAWKLGVKR